MINLYTQYIKHFIFYCLLSHCSTLLVVLYLKISKLKHNKKVTKTKRTEEADVKSNLTLLYKQFVCNNKN